MIGYTLGDDPLVVGRTPALPLREIFAIFRESEPLDALRALIRKDERAATAVAVASETLSKALGDWLDGRPLKNEAAPLRILAYVARMSTRPTPFGFFASIGEVRCGPSTTITLAGDGTRTLHARPDMAWLLPLAREVEDDATRRLALRVVLNPCILERGGRLHVMNPMNVRRDDGEQRRIEHTPISLKKTDAVAFVMEIVREPVVLAEVVQRLRDRFQASEEQAQKLVDQLWQAGLFISELRPNPCDEPARALGARLAKVHARGDEIASALSEVERLGTLSTQEVTIERYSGLVSALRAIHDVPATLQIDSTHRFNGTLGANVIEDVCLLGDAYVRCSEKISLRTYREAFVRRYEGTDRLVPLLELVNPDFGLGAPAEPKGRDGAGESSRSEELLDIATTALIARRQVVELDQETYERLCPQPPEGEAPERFEIGFQVAASSTQAIDRGDYLVVPSNLMAAIGAGRTVGRFAEALGPAITERLIRFARAAAGDRIVAEMTYLPPTVRSLNVAQRPNPYAYEVPIGVVPDSERTIAPNDLLVGVRDDRFFLYSKSLDREITVRESHVFNTTDGAPDICRFLSFVERDETRTFIGFDWGLASALPVLPRLVRGRVVLAPMTWRAPKALFEGAPDAVMSSVSAFREQWNLPRLAYLRDNDQWLPVDFSSPIALEMLRDQIKRVTSPSLQFCELLPGEDQVWMTPEGGSARYVTEFVASIASSSKPRREVSRLARVDEARRRFGPDSEWLYVKVYAGPGVLDALIAQHLTPLLADLRASQAIDRAFFLRYGDPDSHLRIRLRRAAEMTSAALFDRVSSVCGSLLSSGIIERYSFETYERELERYAGEANIDDVEEVFSEDSARCLASITGGTRTQHRKITDALLSMRWLLDGLLDAAGYAPYLEHRGRPPRKLSAEDWTIAKAVRSGYTSEAQDRLPVFERMRERLATLPETRHYVLDSLLHVHCNRLGLDRACEMRAMEILWHVCSGVLAERAKRATVL